MAGRRKLLSSEYLPRTRGAPAPKLREWSSGKLIQLGSLGSDREHNPHTLTTSELFDLGRNKSPKIFTYMEKGICFIFVLSWKHLGPSGDKSRCQVEMALRSRDTGLGAIL